ncbi:DUF6788 family protein [Thermus sediminis]|uniref:DUF6788 family protein n=1 Tax=Thermus sediminis TaxID=1761908 RepID=UPI000E3B9CA7|nr:DUF6788 family protein [Thermus sediminis]
MRLLPRSEAELRLQALEAELARVEEEIRRLYPGVRVKWVRCGKANCWCARTKGTERKPHGPYFYRYRWLPSDLPEGGRQEERYLGKGLPDEAKAGGWRELRRLGKRLALLRQERERLLKLFNSMEEGERDAGPTQV